MSMPDNLRVLKYVEAIREATEQGMDDDESVFMMGLDVDDHKSIQGSTAGLLEKFGKERVFTTPLSEDAMTGIAIGAAMAGRRPIHVHIRMDFLLLCMNQLINIAAKSHYMYGGEVKVPLVIRTMIGKSWGQGAQHSQGLHAMFAHVPGIKIVAPSNAYDAKGLMLQALKDDNPIVIMEHRLLYHTEAFVPEARYTVDFGQAKTLKKGTDITLVGVSSMVMECMRAAELLADAGINAEVIDPVSISPLDTDTILASVKRTGKLIVVDNSWVNCGISGEIVAKIVEDETMAFLPKIKRMGFAETTCPTTPTLEDVFYPSVEKIARQAHQLVTGEANWQPDPDKCAELSKIHFKGPF
ncbi:MAG: transketolase C-terminal domain-containing protein [Pseudomonadota bacterium]|nr:transketolase C-terminal domain-containing protein [Pseudomonadota bacterium]